MTVDTLEKAHYLYTRLVETQRQQKEFAQNRPDFAAKHWAHPWCMLTDDEWEDLTAKIAARYKEKVAELEKEFAAL